MEQAILMASGMGTRMHPLTLTTPKPLVQVAGRPMIETVIDGLLRRGIEQITVVAGYLADQFCYLQEKYPQVRIVVNPDYQTVNNISSVRVAADVLRSGDDCFICEADLFVTNPGIFDATFEGSFYYGKMVPGHSDDWVFETGTDGWITRVGKIGDDCYNMTGICFLTSHDAGLLADYIDQAYASGGYEDLFWDEIVGAHLDTLKLRVHPVRTDDLREIDTVEELELARKDFENLS